MKKIRLKVFYFRRVFVNAAIAMMICLLGGLTIWGSVRTISTSNMVNGVYYSGDTSTNNVSLMINVYWGTEYLDDMLAVLQEKDVKTTFFVGGTWAVLNENMLNKIKESGHEIANHGYHHKDHDKISQSENLKEISNTHKIVKELTGIEMNLFAPPSGAYNKTTVESATNLGYKTIMWTRDTIDWRDKNTDLIYNRAIKDAKGGDLILMHPTANTLEALPKIIENLKSNKLNPTTVTNTLNEGTTN